MAKLNGDCAAVCSKCNKATTGKIYDPYWCADCKINDLEENVKFYKEAREEAVKSREDWIKRYNDQSIEKTKYRCASEYLYEKLTKG